MMSKHGVAEILASRMVAHFAANEKTGKKGKTK
jgi:hypothetical protein